MSSFCFMRTRHQCFILLTVCFPCKDSPQEHRPQGVSPPRQQQVIPSPSKGCHGLTFARITPPLTRAGLSTPCMCSFFCWIQLIPEITKALLVKPDQIVLESVGFHKVFIRAEREPLRFCETPCKYSSLQDWGVCFY